MFAVLMTDFTSAVNWLDPVGAPVIAPAGCRAQYEPPHPMCNDPAGCAHGHSHTHARTQAHPWLKNRYEQLSQPGRGHFVLRLSGWSTVGAQPGAMKTHRNLNEARDYGDPQVHNSNTAHATTFFFG